MVVRRPWWSNPACAGVPGPVCRHFQDAGHIGAAGSAGSGLAGPCLRRGPEQVELGVRLCLLSLLRLAAPVLDRGQGPALLPLRPPGRLLGRLAELPAVAAERPARGREADAGLDLGADLLPEIDRLAADHPHHLRGRDAGNPGDDPERRARVAIEDLQDQLIPGADPEPAGPAREHAAYRLQGRLVQVEHEGPQRRPDRSVADPDRHWRVFA